MPKVPLEPASDVVAQLRERRAAAGLSQVQLAERVGVSRQAINAIEARRQVPSTTLALKLARALRCTVDALFQLRAGGLIDAHLSPGKSERVALGCVDGRWVGHPLHHSTQTADGVVVEQASGAEGHARVELLGDLAEARTNVLVAGCAPLLGMLAQRLGRQHNDARATWTPANSRSSLELTRTARVHLGGLHLAEAADTSIHVRAAQAAFPQQRATLMNLARWRQGWVVAPGNPLGIRTPEDVCRPDVRLIFREPGAAAQSLLERTMAAAGCTLPLALPGMPCAQRHAEVVDLIRWGVADVGVAIESAALAAGLDFIPLSEERFDLLIPASRSSTPHVLRFLDQIDRAAFRTEARHLPGYDLSTAGHASTVEAEVTAPG